MADEKVVTTNLDNMEAGTFNYIFQTKDNATATIERSVVEDGIRLPVEQRLDSVENIIQAGKTNETNLYLTPKAKAEKWYITLDCRDDPNNPGKTIPMSGIDQGDIPGMIDPLASFKETLATTYPDIDSFNNSYEFSVNRTSDGTMYGVDIKLYSLPDNCQPILKCVYKKVINDNWKSFGSSDSTWIVDIKTLSIGFNGSIPANTDYKVIVEILY